jgi:alpha-L-rhamnosidase
MKLNSTFLSKAFIIILATAFFCSCGNTSLKTLTVENLTCEYLATPMGIETTAPRFAWILNSETNGEHQTAYQIKVSASEKDTDFDENTIWDSGKVNSKNSNNIEYAGKSFEPGKRYWWKVKVWDAAGFEQDWSEKSWFETGLFTDANWKDAKWIGLSKDKRPNDNILRSFINRNMTESRMVSAHPSPLFRKAISIKKEIKAVRAYVAGLGYNELFINGNRIGDAVLNPGQTSYNKRAYYDVYDVSSNLVMGENTIGLTLGNGFYGQSIAFGVNFLNYGNPTLRFLLTIEYADGSTESVISDKSWMSTTGPIVFDNVYAGETYDARLEIENWNTTDCDLKGWENATELQDVKVPVLTAQLLQPIKKIEYLPVVNFYKAKTGKYIYDLGQNISGWARIKVNEPAGTKITIRYSEILTEDKQELEPATTGPHATGFVQTEIYICKGTGDEVWEPRFTYHGFRFMEVEGISSPNKNSLDVCFVRTAVEKNGSFLCSDELLNKVYSTSMWTIEDNLHSVPEDCPHREKCAWLGDAHTSVEVMNYNYDMRRMWIKFMKDVVSNHGTGIRTHEGLAATAGIPTNIAVGRRVCLQARPDWGAATILIPWNNYVFYKNTRILEENYKHMVHWMDYLKPYLEDDILSLGYGDWCHVDWKGRDSIPTPVALTSTAYYYYSLKLMNDISLLLNKPEKAKLYNQESELIKTAFNKKFLNETLMTYGTQTGNVVALDMGLVPDGKEKEVAESLAKIELEQKHDGHFMPGVHGMKRLFTMLSEYGYEEQVFNMMRKEKFPSFKYLFDHDFTTWPESFQDFETNKGSYAKGSHNHPMQSAFAMWFHQNAGGIKPDNSKTGFEHFTIKPFGYNNLEFVNASYQSVYGEISSEWKVNGSQFSHEIKIPVNTTALVSVPTSNPDAVKIIQNKIGADENVIFKGYAVGFASYLIASGEYEIESKL